MTAKPVDTSLLNRSQVSNGSKLFIGGSEVDGRSSVARRFRDHIADLAGHVGGDPSVAQQILIREIATLATLNELDQAHVASGVPIDEDGYVKRANALERMLNRLGLARTARDVTPRDSHAAAILDAADD